MKTWHRDSRLFFKEAALKKCHNRVLLIRAFKSWPVYSPQLQLLHADAHARLKLQKSQFSGPKHHVYFLQLLLSVAIARLRV